MKLNPLFSDGVVFQAGKPIRVFGTGDGRAVAEMDGVSAEAVSRDGFWRVDLPARPYGGPHELSVTMNGETTRIRDVRIGETLLMAGQSNMQFKLRESSTESAAFEDDDLVRLFTTLRPEGGERFTPADGWVPCRRDDARDWPAIPYFTANLLRKRFGCAVGVAVAYQGASTIQSWMPLGAFNDNRFAIPDALKHPDHFAPAYRWNRTAVLYNAVFRQIVPFSFGRVVWYQGESNTTPAEGAVYAQMLAEMTAAWRRDLDDDSLPFDIVQIADFTPRDDEGWKSVQKAQAEACASIPNARLVPCADICEKDQIHPPTKSRLAARLANCRQASVPDAPGGKDA